MEYLWVERYRPQTIADTILPAALKQTFEKIVESGEMQNMLFTGTAGLGKTTVAKALCKQLGLDYIVVNGSEEGNIDTLRGRIKQFASTVSFGGAFKVVILDEADYLNPQSTQPALRAFMEEFSDNCRFILTANFANKIIEPLRSRCAVFTFNTTKKELAALAAAFYNRLQSILVAENVPFDAKAVADLIMMYAPDWRRMLNEAQNLASRGGVTIINAPAVNDGVYNALFTALKAKDFKAMRSWVVNNQDVDNATLIRGIYDRMYTHVDPGAIPQLVITLADYQYKNAFVADHELNMVACLTELMAGVRFK